MNLAKAPASTVQILGAEKALFRALKTKHDTPKYGLIYHASLIGQASAKHKGRISRVLAAKTALSIRVDALGDTSTPTVALEARAKVEARLRVMEQGARGAGAGAPKARKQDGGSLAPSAAAAASSGGGGYNAGSDFAVSGKKRRAPEAEEQPAAAAAAAADDEEEAEPAPKKAKKAKDGKEKKEKKEKKGASGVLAR